MKTEDLELFLTMFQGFSWNARAMATHGQDKLFDAWDRGEPDKPPKIKPSQIIRLIERLDRSGQGEVLDAIDRIFTRENEEGVER